MKKVVKLFAVLFVITNVSIAQNHIVHGVIHTLDSIPLEGVEVLVKSSKDVVLTDSLGNFTAFCNEKDKLRVRVNGFYNENVKVSEKTKLVAINMKMKPGEKQREYAIGYGNISEQDKTNAVSNLDNNDMNFSRFSNIIDVIESMGAEVRNGEVVIRGTRSFQGSSAALIVIDGAIVDYDYLATLKPIEVKSIDIIRDGSSSIYGSRGVNGVVIIKTLNGK